MKITLIICFLLPLIGSCIKGSDAGSSDRMKNNVHVANQFIEAFYSFDNDTLTAILSQAIESQPSILYYQKWAECGNYEIIRRHDCILENDSNIVCPVTVKDDLIGALKIDFNVTDSFHLTIKEGQITSVWTSSNDPAIYYEAKEWVKQNLPELIEEPCKGIREGEPSPCDCVRAMVKGYTEFIAARNQIKTSSFK